MTFFPAIAIGGYAGLRVFEQSADRQRQAFEDNAVTQRSLEYLRENISSATTSQALVEDRRLLEVALAAFGLEEEIDKRAIIRRVLDDGVAERTAFANRLGDQRWRDFASFFSYATIEGAPVDDPAFLADLEARFLERSFEARVGDVEPDFRLALNFRREIQQIAASDTVDQNGWLQVLGRRPLRTVLDAAFGLPQEFGALDIDRQRAVYAERAESFFGSSSASVFQDPEKIEDAIRRYFAVNAASAGPGALTPGASSLSLFTPAAGPGSQAINLILSGL